MTEFLRSIESNYGRVATDVEVEPLVLDDALKRNIRIAVGKLTNLEVSKLPQTKPTVTESISEKRSLVRIDDSLTQSNPTFEVESTAVAEQSNPSSGINSKPSKSSVGKALKLKFKKDNPEVGIHDVKSPHSNRSVKSIDISIDAKVKPQSRSTSKVSKINTISQFKNVLSTIAEVNTLKAEDSTTAKKPKNILQADSSIDLRSKLAPTPSLTNSKLLMKNIDRSERNQSRQSTGKTEPNTRPPAKKFINLEEFKKVQKSPKKDARNQDGQGKVEDKPKRNSPEYKISNSSRFKLVSPKVVLTTKNNKDPATEVAEKKEERLSSVSENRSKNRGKGRPMSAFENHRNKDKLIAPSIKELENVLMKEPSERGKTPISKIVKQKNLTTQENSKALIGDTNPFLKKIKEPQIKMYRVGEYKRDQLVHKRNSSKPVYISKGPEGELNRISWKMKQDDRPESKHKSSKITSTKTTDINSSKIDSAKKPRPSTGALVKKRTISEKREADYPLFNHIKTDQSQLIRKSGSEYCLLNLLYGIYSAASYSDSNGVLIRQPIRYKVTEGNNGRLVESLIRQKSYVESEGLNYKANIQWSQLNHKKLVTSTIKLFPKLLYKDLALKSEFSGLDLQDPKSLTSSFQEKEIFHCSNLSLIKSLLEANIKQNSITVIMPEALNIANHINGISSISHKTKLTESIIRYAKGRGIDPFTIIPKTFLVRMGTFESDIEKIAFAKKKEDGFANPVIVKPGENSNRGCGIVMAYSLVETVQSALSILRSRKGTNCAIVQYYITNPLLYKKRKFDIRCYGLVIRYSNRTLFFWYKDGYARTSSYEFSVENKKNLMVHLTNEAVQVQGK